VVFGILSWHGLREWMRAGDGTAPKPVAFG
jgi:hypothetical protein